MHTCAASLHRSRQPDCKQWQGHDERPQKQPGRWCNMVVLIVFAAMLIVEWLSARVPLYLKKLVAGNPSCCIASGRDTTADYIWVNVTECSIFMLTGSPKATPTPSGGGGGEGTYPSGWFGTPAPAVTATKAPAASATGTVTVVPPGERETRPSARLHHVCRGQVRPHPGRSMQSAVVMCGRTHIDHTRLYQPHAHRLF